MNPLRLLTRDFIHDSLYNPEYGYFSKKAVIFSPPKDIAFTELSSMHEFTRELTRLYARYEEVKEDGALQIWHTPTEIFKVFQLT